MVALYASPVFAFADVLPPLERAHASTRLVIPKRGCQLAASLLALELGRAGLPAEYVCGRYSANPEQEHWWVVVDSVLLDPSRDQFDDEDPSPRATRGGTAVPPVSRRARWSTRQLCTSGSIGQRAAERGPRSSRS